MYSAAKALTRAHMCVCVFSPYPLGKFRQSEIHLVNDFVYMLQNCRHAKQPV